MFDQNENNNRSVVSNLIPGFSFYEGIGNSLGEFLVDFFEAVAGVIGKFKT